MIDCTNWIDVLKTLSDPNPSCTIQNPLIIPIVSTLILSIIGIILHFFKKKLLNSWSIMSQKVIRFWKKIIKKKLTLVICISHETEEEKMRIKNDFIQTIKDLIQDQKLSREIDLKIENNDQLLDKLNNYHGSQEEIKYINEVVSGDFFIYGSVKKRDESKKDTFILNLKPLVMPGKISKISDYNQNLIQDSLNEIWISIYNINKQSELTGFVLSAELSYISSIYILAISTFISKNYVMSEKLFKSFNSNILEKYVNFPKLRGLKLKTDIFLSAIYFNYATEEHKKRSKKQGDIDQHIAQSLKYDHKNYSTYLLKAKIEFESGNVKSSKNTIKKARNHSNSDSTWMYSEAFLFLWQKEYNKSLVQYKKLNKKNCFDEQKTVEDVCKFIKKLHKNNLKRNDLLFILGFLHYNKTKDFGAAKYHFDNFISKTINDPQLKILRDYAKVCLSDIGNQNLKFNLIFRPVVFLKETFFKLINFFKSQIS